MFELIFSNIHSTTKNLVWVGTKIDQLPSEIDDKDKNIINKELNRSNNVVVFNDF
jgi:hypothetical protein